MDKQKIINPLTNRLIEVGGTTYNKLVKNGTIKAVASAATAPAEAAAPVTVDVVVPVAPAVINKPCKATDDKANKPDEYECNSKTGKWNKKKPAKVPAAPAAPASKTVLTPAPKSAAASAAPTVPTPTPKSAAVPVAPASKTVPTSAPKSAAVALKTLPIRLLQIDKPIEIPLYQTDTEDDVKIRIAVEQDQPLASIIFPVDFEFTKFIKDPSKTEVLDLFSIMPSVQEFKEAKKLYRKIKTTYDFGIEKFTEFMICKQLWGYVSSKKPVSQMIFKQIEETIAINWHLDKEDNILLEKWWPKDIKYFMERIKNFQAQKHDDDKINKVNVENGEKYDAAKPMSVVDEQITGYIIRFMFTTTQTTGELFDQFITTPDFPVARYKTFYKIHLSNTENVKQEPILPSILHDLQIFNKEGDVNIHVINTPEGLNIQCLLILGSSLSTTEDVIAFLNLQGKITTSEQFGVRTQFYIKNMCIDPSVFSDMVINDVLFKKFLSVNDTDKISRQNKSVYLYFTDPQSEIKFEKEEIYVGGWKRTFSRYGALTAILNCEIDDENTYKVSIRILRSVDENILHSFKNKIGVFMTLYRQNETSMLKLYKELIPSFTPFKPQYEDVKHKKDPIDILNEAEPRIFVKNMYGITCQEVKPIIVEDEKVIDSLPENKKLIFPPVEFEGMKPRVYTCPGPELMVKGSPNKHIYPGLKELQPGSEHPFGYVPCCYIEKIWLNKNKKINKTIEKIIKGEAVKEEVKKI